MQHWTIDLANNCYMYETAWYRPQISIPYWLYPLRGHWWISGIKQDSTEPWCTPLRTCFQLELDPSNLTFCHLSLSIKTTHSTCASLQCVSRYSTPEPLFSLQTVTLRLRCYMYDGQTLHDNEPCTQALYRAASTACQHITTMYIYLVYVAARRH